MTECVHGAAAWELANDQVRLWVSCRGGHMAPVKFQLGERWVSPYALAPWKPDEVDPSLPDLLKILRGDFFCFPFGPRSVGPPHGASANAEWALVEKSSFRLHLDLDDPHSGGRVEKILTLREGETAIYCEHRVSGMEGRYSYGNHPILDFSHLQEGEGRVSVSAFRWASVYPGFFSDPAKEESGALKPSGRFSDLREVPMIDGGTTDLTRYPARRGFDDLVMMVSEPSTRDQPFAWSAAVLDGYAWISLKNPVDFPATMFWISNGGRRGAPWNGRHLSRLGIEEVCSHFSDGVEVSRADPLLGEGISTARDFRADETITLRVVQAVAAVPRSFGRVTSIKPGPEGGVVISDESGVEVHAAIDWRYLQPEPFQPENP